MTYLLEEVNTVMDLLIKMRYLIFLLLLAGCTTLTHQATIKVYENKIEFYSKSSEFQAKVKKGDIEAEYNSQKPSLIEDVLKAMTIRQVNRE